MTRLGSRKQTGSRKFRRDRLIFSTRHKASETWLEAPIRKEEFCHEFQYRAVAQYDCADGADRSGGEPGAAGIRVGGVHDFTHRVSDGHRELRYGVRSIGQV